VRRGIQDGGKRLRIPRQHEHFVKQRLFRVQLEGNDLAAPAQLSGDGLERAFDAARVFCQSQQRPGVPLGRAPMRLVLFTHECVEERLHLPASGLKPNPGEKADGQFARRAFQSVRLRAAGSLVCCQ